MKHTPGPWKYEFREYCCLIDAPDANIYGLAIVGEEWTTEEDPQTEANARLIAAAPDLLEACEIAIESDDLRVKDILRDAVAKAKEEA